MQNFRFLFVENVVDPTSDRQSGRMRWLLISSNNRQLGQDAALTTDYAECRAAAIRLQRDRSLVTPHILTGERDGRWIWRLTIDGVAVATACRSYQRVRECEYNLARFLEGLAEAGIVEGVRRVGADGRGMSRPARIAWPPVAESLRAGRA